MVQTETESEHLHTLAEEWVELWQSEWAALAEDPEWLDWASTASPTGQIAGPWDPSWTGALGAEWFRLLATCAATRWPGTPASAQAWDEQDLLRPGAASGKPSSGTPPAPAASVDGGDASRSGAADGGGGVADELAALRQRLVELERRLASVESGADEGRAHSPRARRPRTRA